MFIQGATFILDSWIGQKSKNNFIWLLVQMGTWKFDFEINWPLESEQFTPSSNREDTVYYSEMASSMAP